MPGNSLSPENAGSDPGVLLDLIKTKMPFGKYKGILICDLPVSYLEYFAREGFPKGKLGMLLQTMHVVATNGLRQLLDPLRGGS
jgi:uncharacterized protein (DUF3820 family)